MLKVVNLVKVFSVLIFLGTLSLVYAYMPIMVKLDEEGMTEIHKENFFYGSVGVFIVVNVLILIIQNMINKKAIDEFLKAWVGGFTFVFNLYLAFIIGFLGVLNNPTHIPASSYYYLNWLGPIMVLVWLIGLIFLVLKRK
ncbi:MAG: hypothetical protein RLQ12_16025 [Cyclobacteriaceae bacterium]